MADVINSITDRTTRIIDRRNRLDNFLTELSNLTRKYRIIIACEDIGLYGLEEEKENQYSCYAHQLCFENEEYVVEYSELTTRKE